jgi:hypothetical protein
MTDLKKAQTEFEKLADKYLHSNEDIISFKRFVLKSLKSRFIDEEVEENEEKINIFHDIRKELKNKVGLYAEAPEEKIYYPGEGSFDGFTDKNTINVDGFLYDDNEVQELQESEKLPTFYCNICGSKDVKKLNFISHSLTHDELEWIFQDVLGQYDLSKLTIMDVGSRLGAALYYAYLFTPVKKIIGVEINPFFSNLQQQIVKKYHMEDRVQVIEKDVLELGQIINIECDVLIMHNVFEFFCDRNTLKQLWHTLRNHILTKKGLLLITSPSIEKSLSDAGITDIVTKNWIKEIPLKRPVDEESNEEYYTEFCLYQVI